jgi:hypothetical protein
MGEGTSRNALPELAKGNRTVRRNVRPRQVVGVSDFCSGKNDLRQRERPAPLQCFLGPNGDVLTIADLPPPNTTRWVRRRKAEVVLAVRAGLLSLDAACERYGLTAEEFSYWEGAVKKQGLPKLRRTEVQQSGYRQKGVRLGGRPSLPEGWNRERISEGHHKNSGQNRSK